MLHECGFSPVSAVSGRNGARLLRGLKQLVAGLAAVAFSGALLAQGAGNYPNKPIRGVIPFEPGGATSMIVRIVAAEASVELGVPVVVDNRGGAAGMIGATLVGKAVPDGYTLLFGGTATHSLLPVIQPNISYDPIKDFAPISVFASAPVLLVSNPSVPAQTVKELIALVRSKPGAVSYATAGIGSHSHFAIAQFLALSGIATDALHVPFRGGAPAAVGIITNEAQFYFGPMAGLITTQVKAGKLRALAVGSTKRSTYFPDVPTAAEAGVPGYQSEGWFGLFAPARTPKAIITRLYRAVNHAVDSPGVRRQLLTNGIEPKASSSPEEFARFVAEELATNRKLVKDFNMRFE